MIVSRAWAGKRYGVLGLARSGSATVRALLAAGGSVVAWDADEAKRDAILPRRGRGTGAAGGGGAPRNAPLVESPLHHVAARRGPPPPPGEDLVVADLDTVDLATLDALVVSPGVPLNTHPLVARARGAGVPIIGDIELFAQARAELLPHKVVGITGTNGKSTTTALIHHILKTAGMPSLMGGNIGLPILEQEPLPAGGVYVLELSSYQIDLTQSLDCDVAVLTNITPDHLDRYDGFEAYVASKARLFEMQSGGRVAVIVADGPSGETIRSRFRARAWPTSFEDWMRQGVGFGGGSINGEWRRPYLILDGDPAIPQEEWPNLQGPHNARNVVAAAAVAEAIGISSPNYSALRKALATFTGLPHRMERVATLDGVTYIDDSKATNPESAAPALAAFRQVHWIVGGRAKGDDLDACTPHFGHVRRAYTIGEAGPRFAAVLREAGVAVEEAGTLAVAVARAAATAARGEAVLLSPACASFDQFSDYAARGLAFRRAVEALPVKEPAV